MPEKRSMEIPSTALWGLACIIVLGIMALSFKQPLSADDFTNSVVLRSHSSLAGFVGYYYAAWTGRATGMAFLWLALRSHAAYAIINGLAFATLTSLTVACGLGRAPRLRGTDPAVVGIVTATYWYGMPAISETIMWATGSVTYMWSAVLMLTFLLPYRIAVNVPDMARRRRGWPRIMAACVGMLVLGVLTGASHELVAVAAVVVLVAYFADAYRGRRLRSAPAHLWAGTVGLVGGSAVLFLSPGNGARSATSGNHASSLAGSLGQFVTYLAKTFGAYLPHMYPWLLLVLVLAIPAALIRGTPDDERDRRRYWAVWLFAGVATLLPFVFEPGIALLAGARTDAFVAVLLTVAVVSLLSNRQLLINRIPLRWLNLAVVVVLALVLVEIVGSVQVASAIRSQATQREAYIASQKRAEVLDISVPPLAQKPYRTVYYVDLEADPGYWLNQGLAQWYGVRSIRLSAWEPQ